MESFGPLLFLLFFSFVVSMISKALQSAKKTQSPKKPAAPKEEKAPASAPVKQAELSPEDRILRPTIQVTEHDDSVYQGSMNAVTGEGYDPCHDEQLAPLTLAETVSPEPRPAAPSPILPHWTGEEIARGFVMTEILKKK